MAATPTLPRTISLIGMPGVGKSSVGVILAKLSGLRFVDTDLDIQVREGATLQQILDRQGYRRLRAIEQEVLLSITLEGAIIATGGSAVYSEQAMRRLKSAGPVVYLEADLPTLEQRVSAAPLRGIASSATQSYAEVFAERTPLYRQHADITADAGGSSVDRVAADILRRLSGAA